MDAVTFYIFQRLPTVDIETTFNDTWCMVEVFLFEVPQKANCGFGPWGSLAEHNIAASANDGPPADQYRFLKRCFFLLHPGIVMPVVSMSSRTYKMYRPDFVSGRQYERSYQGASNELAYYGFVGAGVAGAGVAGAGVAGAGAAGAAAGGVAAGGVACAAGGVAGAAGSVTGAVALGAVAVGADAPLGQ